MLPHNVKQNDSFERQLAKLVKARARRGYEHDIGQLTAKLKSGGVSRGHLGDMLEQMARQGKLLPELVQNDNDEFRILQHRDLGHNTIEYLNFLQHDKLFCCRLCYTHADWLWCDFHKTHTYNGPCDVSVDSYVEHLNSDMGVVTLVEKYYHYLSTDKSAAMKVLKTLIKFESLAEALTSYNFSADDADVPAYELMDFD